MCVIFSPEIESDRERHYKRLRDLLDSEGVELIAEKDWGLKKFAYPIKKHTSGYYSFFYFKAAKETPRKISEDFKMQEDVLRHLLIKRTIGKDINLDDLTREEMLKVETDYDAESIHDSGSEDNPEEKAVETGETNEDVIQENEPSYETPKKPEATSTEVEKEDTDTAGAEDSDQKKEKVTEDDENEVTTTEDVSKDSPEQDASDEQVTSDAEKASDEEASKEDVSKEEKPEEEEEDKE
ncbi:MAG: 30S ribosomal protein S6 [Candidatus Zixiibacteriota bacterium]